jgi:hypothetical protein
MKINFYFYFGEEIKETKEGENCLARAQTSHDQIKKKKINYNPQQKSDPTTLLLFYFLCVWLFVCFLFLISPGR